MSGPDVFRERGKCSDLNEERAQGRKWWGSPDAEIGPIADDIYLHAYLVPGYLASTSTHDLTVYSLLISIASSTLSPCPRYTDG